ncbi:unnamed protein product [Rhizophagus irregularis]|nr:unnamed protein product [Rhizophagus irregularis]
MGEIVDCYLNRIISPIERIRMATTEQSFAIFTSLCESMLLLVKAHRDYYPQIPFLPWLHGSESCSGINKQSHNDNEKEYDLSSAISEASLEMKRITIEDDKEQESNDDFVETHFQLNEIAQPPDNLYILNGGDSVDLSCRLDRNSKH